MQLTLTFLIMVLVTASSVYCAIFHLEKKYLKDEKLFSAQNYYYVLVAGVCLLGCVSAYMVNNNSVSYFATAKLLGTYVLISMAAIYDYKTRTIPNYIPLSLVCFSVVVLVFESIFTDNTIPFLISSVSGSFASMAVLYIAAKLSKGGVGYGDVKIFGAIGLCVGFYAVFTVLTLSIAMCALFAAPLLFMKKKTMRGDLPFAPFIYLAYTATLILSLY